MNRVNGSYNVLKDFIHCRYFAIFGQQVYWHNIIITVGHTRKGIQFSEKKDTFLTLLPIAIISRDFRDLEE